MEVVEALQSVFEALHDPSIIDARRNQRYDLYPPFVVTETPHDVSISRFISVCNVMQLNMR